MTRSCIALAALLLIAVSAPALTITNSWEVQLPGPVALRQTVPQGERVVIATRWRSGRTQVNLTGCTADYLYRTNNMSTWFTAPATVDAAASTVYVPWGPELDPGAARYSGWVRVLSGTNPVYRCELLLQMLTTPGHVPNATALTQVPIDFARLTWTNAPWATSAELDAEISARIAGDVAAATNLQAAVDAKITAAQAGAIAGATNAPTAALAAAALQPDATNGLLRAEADTLATVTARGAATTDAVTIGDAGVGDAGDKSLRVGTATVASGSYSFAQGGGSIASGSGSSAMGDVVVASGIYSHAQGSSTLASGASAHAEGTHTEASGDYSHAQGKQTIASGYASHAAGWLARATNDYSYVWNGLESETYYSHGDGTFNVAPRGGLAGFYVDSQALADVVAAPTNALAVVAHTGGFYDLLSRPTVLASNPVDVAAVQFGGASGWVGWTGTTGVTISPAGSISFASTAGDAWAGTTGPVVTGLASIVSVISTTTRGAWMRASTDGVTFEDPGLMSKADRTLPLWLAISSPAPPPGPQGTAAVSRISCDVWRDLSRVGEVFPVHGVSVRVDDPDDSLDAANRAYVDRRADISDASAAQALRWWEQRAQGDAHMGGYRLHLGGDWSILQEGDGWGALSFDGSVGLGVVGDSTQFAVQLASENILIARFDTEGMAITAWSGKKLAPTQMYLTVSTNGLPASPDADSAWAEYAQSITAGLWYRVPDQVVSLPTNAATFRVAFPNPEPAATSLYFRVMRESGNLAALRSMVPLRAPSMMISESNSVAVATTPGVIVMDSIAGNPAAISGHGQIYAVAGELWVMDGSGNATRISSHDGAAWVQVSANLYTGWGTRFDVASGLRERFRLSELRDWDADQAALAARQADAVAKWDAQPAAERRAARPEAYAPRPMPDWMVKDREAKDDPAPIKSGTAGKVAETGGAAALAGAAAYAAARMAGRKEIAA